METYEIVLSVVMCIVFGMIVLLMIYAFNLQNSCDHLGMEFKQNNRESFNYCVDKEKGIAYPVIIEENGFMNYEAKIIEVKD